MDRRVTIVRKRTRSRPSSRMERVRSPGPGFAGLRVLEVYCIGGAGDTKIE